MDGKRMKEIIGAFFTNNGSEICKEIPELTDCKELKKQYEDQINKKGGCTPCRKRSVTNKFKKLIQSRIK